MIWDHLNVLAATIVVTYGITSSSLFAPLRVPFLRRVERPTWGLVAMALYCPICTSFWVALVTALMTMADAHGVWVAGRAALLTNAIIILCVGAGWWPESPFDTDLEHVAAQQEADS